MPATTYFMSATAHFIFGLKLNFFFAAVFISEDSSAVLHINAEFFHIYWAYAGSHREIECWSGKHGEHTSH